MTTITLDIAWDCPLGDFLTDLEEFNGVLTSFIADGPGGGNPELTLTFQDPESARAFINKGIDSDL